MASIPSIKTRKTTHDFAGLDEKNKSERTNATKTSIGTFNISNSGNKTITYAKSKSLKEENDKEESLVFCKVAKNLIYTLLFCTKSFMWHLYFKTKM